MGYAKILWIYEDGIRSLKHDAKDLGALARAVLAVSVGRTEAMDPSTGQSKPLTSAAVLHHGNCVNLCDSVHSGQQALYVWSGNCLRRLYEIDDADLAAAESLICEEKTRRQRLASEGG